MNAVHSRKGRIGLAVTLAAGLCASTALAEVESPYATGGEVTTFLSNDGKYNVYIHTFTDTSEAGTFKNVGKMPLLLRYLVVGAGGAGAKGYGTYGGGGGGGGGGVYENEDYNLAVGGQLTVTVGKGASAVEGKSGSGAAGSSALTDGASFAVTVPGGGNGAYPGTATTADKLGCGATQGAGGGGGTRNAIPEGGETAGNGAAGTYQSSQFGKSPKGTSEGVGFAGGNYNNRVGAGGGGASSAGNKNGAGGEGLASDITGESLVYGSGGGAGSMFDNTGTGFQISAKGGGTRAGDGGNWERITLEDGQIQTNFFAATLPIANSGGGGGGGLAGSSTATTADKVATGGADGVVVIRYQIPTTPCEGGDVITRTELRPGKYRYLHVFTNATEAAKFVNWTDRDLKLRYLVVGAGGAGGYGSSENSDNQYSLSGGGGGGGGVCEVKNVPFAPGTRWSILVGKGAEAVQSVSKPGTAAGTSSISNETGKVVEVPGGGNGATSDTAKHAVNATDGAAGGGATTYATTIGVGNYKSSIFGDIPEGAPFDGGTGGSYMGGGGGGAAAAGTKYTTSRAGDGGKGLSSDITGESLVYGSGGGGGAHAYYNRAGGLGGTRAGNGATYEITDGGATTNFFAATAPAANSGCGGAGGMQKGYCNVATGGADGVVIIRYDYDPTPPGLMLLFK